MAEQIVVSQGALDSLNATRPWVKFIAIVGFVMCGLLVLVSLAAFAGSAMIPGGLGALVGVFEIAFAALYFFPCLYMLRYAKGIAGIPSSGQMAFEQALSSQKSFWKFAGIITLIMIIVYVVGIIAAVGLGMMAGHH